MARKLTLGITFLALLVLVGCNLPSRINLEEETPSALTLAVMTVHAQETLLAQTAAAPTNTPPPSQPTITLAPTDAPDPTDQPAEDVCDLANFVDDVNIPDGTEFLPGESFTKTWRIRNEGSCSWNSDYDVVFDDGDAMGADPSTQISKADVAPGKEVDISVEMVAPTEEGTYRGTWQLRNDAGVIFTTTGFWVEIKVIEPEIFSSKTSFKIEQAEEGDLDQGASPPVQDADFQFYVASPNDKQIKPLNGAEFLLMGEDQVEYGHCNEADLESDPIQVDEDLVGQ
ncbi:MAG: NBR1-Ig-like domain-containing protein, partial [Anaerolineales bacterium]